MSYKLKLVGQDEEDFDEQGFKLRKYSEFGDELSPSLDSKLTALLTHQMSEIKYKDFLRLYLFQLERFFVKSYFG